MNDIPASSILHIDKSIDGSLRSLQKYIHALWHVLTIVLDLPQLLLHRAWAFWSHVVASSPRLRTQHTGVLLQPSKPPSWLMTSLLTLCRINGASIQLKVFLPLFTVYMAIEARLHLLLCRLLKHFYGKCVALQDAIQVFINNILSYHDF